MTQQPKRIPGERNPTPNVDAPMRPVHQAEVAQGHGMHGMGDASILRGVIAMVQWFKRRKARNGRNS